MFRKLTAIEPVSLEDWAEEKLHTYAEEVVLYRDIPENDEEIIRRIGDSDAVLVSYTTRIGRNVIEACPQIRYIGMCCSLYSEESANVDIACARERGIRVLGIRDYGDRGVVEFVLSELVRFLHGFDRPMLYDIPTEITGLKAGIIGLWCFRNHDCRGAAVYGSGGFLFQPYPQAGKGGSRLCLPSVKGAFGRKPGGICLSE